MKRFYILGMINYLMLAGFFACLKNYGYEAVVIVPVADMLGQYAEDVDTEPLYGSLPYYSRVADQHACPRVYQALFNEIVEVVEEGEHECKVLYPAATYLSNGTLQNTFCMLKKHLLPLSEVGSSSLPSMPDFRTGLDSFSQDDVVLADSFTTLLSSGNLTFSAGTRFKKCFGAHNKVYCLNEIIEIPHDTCVENAKDLSHAEKVLTFLNTLKQWAHNPRGSVPYLWGGGSVGYYIEHGVPFEQISEGTRTSWGYANYNFTPKNGVDCSSMIMRAAQIAGLPFFYRNTYTIEHYLCDISAHNYSIENGDIIWYKGHAMVISDVEKNLCIESRGYPAGYGRLQEIELKHVFQGVETFNDLTDAFRRGAPLNLLNKRGDVMLTIETFKILTLASAKDLAVSLRYSRPAHAEGIHLQNA